MSTKKVKEAEAVSEEVTQQSKLAEAKRALSGVKMALKKKLGDDIFTEKVIGRLPSISTGSALIDKEIGNNWLVLGRVHEIFGNTGSAKTTLATLTMINALKQYPDKFVLYMDFEQAFNLEYSRRLGLDPDDERFIFMQPSSIEDGFEIVDRMVSTGILSLVVMDSVPAMISRREMEADYDKETMAEKPRVLSRSIPKLLEPLKEANTALVFINQIRDKLSYGGGTTTPGGKAIPFFATTRLELKRSDILTEKDVAYGQVMTAIVRKNKVGRPYGTIKTDLFFGVGFNYTKEVVIIAKELGIIDGSTWLYLPEANEDGEVIKIQGVDNVVEYYNNNPDKFENLKTKIQQRLDYSLVADTVKAKDIKDEEGY